MPTIQILTRNWRKINISKKIMAPTRKISENNLIKLCVIYPKIIESVCMRNEGHERRTFRTELSCYSPRDQLSSWWSIGGGLAESAGLFAPWVKYPATPTGPVRYPAWDVSEINRSCFWSRYDDQTWLESRISLTLNR